MKCPPCKGIGHVPIDFIGIRVRGCFDCAGTGTLTRDQQHRYFGEAGHHDVDDERQQEEDVREIRDEIYEDLRTEAVR